MKTMRLFETPGGGRAFQRGYLLLAGLQCGAALATLLQTPTVSGALLGLSTFQMLLAAVFLAALLVSAALLAETWLRRDRSARRWERFAVRWTHPLLWWRLFLVCCAVFLGGVSFLALAPGFQEPVAVAYAERLSPLVGLAAGLAGQTIAGLLIFRRSANAFELHPAPRLFFAAMLAFLAVLAAWQWVMGGFGATEAARVGWNRMGAPLVEFQVFLAWCASLGWMAADVWLRRISSRTPTRLRWLAQPDLWLSLVIWAVAVFAWQRVPVEPNWFLMQPLPPNFENYPSSDARAYDTTAQSALIGDGYIYYGFPYIHRPLLAFYMTALRLLGGQDYERVIFFQILILALIPVTLYHLTRQIHTRAAGVLAAALLILREVNSIRISGNVTTSNVKLLMADVPTMLAACGFALLLTLWLKRLQASETQADWRLRGVMGALLCGGVLGLGMLIRLEVFVFFGVVALSAALVLWPRRKPGVWVQQLLVAALGMGLVLAPWITRNYLRTGQLFIGSPHFFSQLLFQRFHPSRDPAPLQTQGPQTQRLPTPPIFISVAPKVDLVPPVWQGPTPTPPAPAAPAPGQNGQVELPPAYFWDNLGPLVQSAGAHFLNSQVQLLLILPTNWRGFESTLAFSAHRSLARWQEDCCRPVGYVRSLPYWDAWDGSFSFSALWLLLINLAGIAWGIQIAWRRSSWAGMTPIFMALIYTAFNSLFRNSGGRYILPVDWVALLYFSIGLAQFTQDVWARLAGRPGDGPVFLSGETKGPSTAPDVSGGATRSDKKITPGGLLPVVMAGVVLFLLGNLPPLLERSLPKRYTDEKAAQMQRLLLQSERLSAAERAQLQGYLAQGAKIAAGRALYPRFFAANVNDPIGQGEMFEARPYPRMTFYLAGGDVNDNLALPIARKPKSFPNGADTLLIMCPDLDILAIALYAPNGALQDVLLRSPFPSGQTCPLPDGVGVQP